VKSRACGQDGFGLIELMIAMVVLNVGILALVAAFNSGVVSLARSAHTSTAATMADKQMELYRGLLFDCIYITPTPTSATYIGDTYYDATLWHRVSAAGASCTAGIQATLPAEATNGSQTSVTGPDRHKYGIDTYIAYYCSSGTLTNAVPPNCGTTRVAEKQVSIVVRDSLTGHIWAREQSTFDQSTGL
jgi:Tfp pilus assembly protein PilE